ncbi:MAG: AAA family ATPase [Sedimentisphaerales bacterium]
MSITIAISGKGGSGKTTIAAMIINSLLDQQDKVAILAVDADPNSCLGLTLGVQPVSTIADIREDARAKGPSTTGIDKLRTFEYGVQQAITEAAGFDLLTMGRPEGPDCYCAVNNMLRQFLDKLSSQYQFVIIDNEAGMEHLSRRTTNNVDLLCIVAEPTSLGVLTAQRIFELAKELPIAIKHIGVIWNRAESSKVLDGIDILGHVPYDKAVFDCSMQQKTIFDLKGNSPAFLAVRKILESAMAEY